MLEESPILQAMLATQKASAPLAPLTHLAPSSAPAAKKKSVKATLFSSPRKVTFSDEPSSAQPRGRTQPFEPMPQERPKRDVNEYTPPTGFFKAIDRPSLGDSRSEEAAMAAKKFKSLFDF